MLVDDELAAARARAPVDPPHAVARRERPDVGELDPVALRARDLVAGVDLRLERLRSTSRAGARRAGRHSARCAGRRLPRTRRGRAGRARARRRRRAGTRPSARSGAASSTALLVCGERSATGFSPGRPPGPPAAPAAPRAARPASARDVGSCLDLLALERALALEPRGPTSRAASAEREPDREQERERRRERDELGPAEHERGEQPERRQAGIGAEPRRCRAGSARGARVG